MNATTDPTAVTVVLLFLRASSKNAFLLLQTPVILGLVD